MTIDIVLLAKSIGEIATAITGTLKIVDKLSGSNFLFFKKNDVNKMKENLTSVSANISKIGDISDGLLQYEDYIVSFMRTYQLCNEIMVQTRERKESLKSPDSPHWDTIKQQFDTIKVLSSDYQIMQNGHGLFFDERDQYFAKPYLDNFFKAITEASTHWDYKNYEKFYNSLNIMSDGSRDLSSILKTRMEEGLKEIKIKSEIIKNKTMSDNGGN